MADTRISDLAGQAGVSVQTVYRIMDRLGDRLAGHVSKVKGVRLVDADGAGMIREALAQTTTKPVAAKTSAEIAAPAPDMTARMEEIGKVLVVLAEEVRATRQELATLRADNQTLRSELGAVRLALAPPPVPARSITPWQPTPQPDPAVTLPWWKVAWCSLFDPAQLRRAES